MITASTLDAAQPGILWDTVVKGFGCKIYESGRRSFFLGFRNIEGKTRRPKIGEYPTLTPEQAREIAKRWLHRAAHGDDPSLAKVEGVRQIGHCSALKRLVIIEQEGRCAGCGLSLWRGEQIPLELEHKNGDRNDNRRENVECLCPNCHALTPTWRGRTKGKKISDRQLKVAIKGAKSICAALRQLGVPNSRYWYDRARKVQ